MAGMVVGALAAGRVRDQRGQVRATIAGAAVACAAVAGFAVAPDVAALVPLSVVGGIGNGCAGTCSPTLLMLRTPDGARGRVSAATSAIFGGVQGASLLFGGVLAAVLSPRAIYPVAGLLGVAATGVVGLVHIVPDAQRAAEEPDVVTAGPMEA
jgi:MFS family permease